MRWLAGLALVVLGLALTVPAALGQGGPASSEPPPTTWAFLETFDGAPAAPSQALLPRRFSYSMTARETDLTHNPQPLPGTFVADHGPHCEAPPATHAAGSSLLSNNTQIDESFFICSNHLMSSAGNQGEGSYYAMTAFYPKQEFDFTGGGILQFDVDLQEKSPLFWTDIILMPRDQFERFASNSDGTWSGDFLPDRWIRFRLGLPGGQTRRTIDVGRAAYAPAGIAESVTDSLPWSVRYPTDPVNHDARLRRTNRIALSDTEISWSTQTQAGTWDTLTLPVQRPLPLHRGLVDFTTHNANTAANPSLTFHWDNIAFTGPALPPYENIVIERGVVPDQTVPAPGYGWPNNTTPLQTFTLDHLGPNPVLNGVVVSGVPGNRLVSVNGGPYQEFTPVDATRCPNVGYLEFHMPIAPSQLRLGANTLHWLIGPDQHCGLTAAEHWWNSNWQVIDTELHFDGTVAPTPVVIGTITPAPTVPGLATPAPSLTPTPPVFTTLTPTSTVSPGATTPPVVTRTATPAATTTVSPVPSTATVTSTATATATSSITSTPTGSATVLPTLTPPVTVTGTLTPVALSTVVVTGVDASDPCQVVFIARGRQVRAPVHAPNVQCH